MLYWAFTVALLVVYTWAATDRIREYSMSTLMRRFSNSFDLIDEPERVAGYFRLDRTVAGEMFYFYFQNRQKDSSAPLAIWINGGPGCSSEYGLFFEQMGPYLVDPDTLQVTENPFGWDKALNIIFVDQPLNVGFSYSTAPEDRVYDEERVAHDMLDFIQVFLEAHPELKEKELYITGESYAGSYIPNIAHRIYEYNLKHQKLPIKLAGIAIGNGMSAPHIQYMAYGDYAYQEGLIDRETLDWIAWAQPVCKEAIEVCYWSSWTAACWVAKEICEVSTFEQVMAENPGMNVYDIRLPCVGSLCYEDGWLGRFLNDPQVQATLGVDRHWEDCNYAVYDDFSGDFMQRSDDLIPDLLHAGVRVLLYAGDKDFICNWLGNRRWVDAMEWNGQSAWLAGKDTTWGEDWGEGHEAEGLTFLKIYNAGHMVPHDQPERSLAMIQSFTSNEYLFDAGLEVQATESGVIEA